MFYLILGTFRLLIKLSKLIIIANFTASILLGLILLLSISIYLLARPPKFEVNEEEFMRILNNYRIKNTYSLIFSIFCITCYVLIFILGILYLRFYNSNYQINLLTFGYEMYLKLTLLSPFMIFLNVTLIISLFLVYILLLAKIVRYLLKHLVKIHLYLLASKYADFYIDLVYFSRINPGYIVVRLEDYILDRLYGKYDVMYEYSAGVYNLPRSKLYNKRSKIIRKIIRPIIFHGHYIVLVFVISYDLIFCNYTLYYFFKILPYVFIYDLYVRITTYCSDLDYTDDLTLSYFIYRRHYMLTANEIIIEGDNLPTELRRLFFIVLIYLRSNLNGYNWCCPTIKVKGEEDKISMRDYLEKIGAYDFDKNESVNNEIFEQFIKTMRK